MNESTSRRAFLRACPAVALLGLGWNLAGCDSAAVDDDGGGPPPGSGIVINGNTITIDLASDQGRPLSKDGRALFISSAKTVALNDGGTIRAFSTVCPHQGCDINSFQNEILRCPCHGSQFNTTGDVVAGPAPRGLTEYSVSRNGEFVVVTKA